ncbi:MAG TPA: Ig-like domain-containing protein [Gemmatimonadaceae bacterium]|nr:Ig-like domain-containing protein [Gemmatimonadaceae bacterium]
MTAITKGFTFTAGVALAGALACGSDKTWAPLDNPLNSVPGAGSAGVAATITLTPRAVSLTVGAVGQVVAAARDDHGTPIARHASWHSSNLGIVTVDDDGIVNGKSAGTAFVYATLDGQTDSATVVVAGGQTNGTPATPAAGSFNLTVSVSGAAPDSGGAAAAVANATISARRAGTVGGDTLTDAPVIGTTGADGKARFERLPGGRYVVDVTPPEGSPFKPSMGSFNSTGLAEVVTPVTLPRKP